jgi:predicted alpha/beta hydrolase family esterase
MKKAYIIHGICDEEEYRTDIYPSSSNSHWLPWLQKEFLKRDIFCQTPEMPNPYCAKYLEWKATFDQFPVDRQTILVGHSCGADFLLKWLAENKAEVEKLILVAPFLDPSRRIAPFFENFKPEPAIVSRVADMQLFYSTDDGTDILDSVKTITKIYPSINIKRFTDKGHFCFEDMGTHAFPELLESSLK